MAHIERIDMTTDEFIQFVCAALNEAKDTDDLDRIRATYITPIEKTLKKDVLDIFAQADAARRLVLLL